MTPEGKIKAYLNKRLKEAFGVRCYSFMPVQMGYGASTVDYLLCVCGDFVAIETKAPGKKLTERQLVTMMQVQKAGGQTFVVDSKEKADKVIHVLQTNANIYLQTEPHYSPPSNGDGE